MLTTLLVLGEAPAVGVGKCCGEGSGVPLSLLVSEPDPAGVADGKTDSSAAALIAAIC